ncbi:hypothetical protein EC2730350_4856 [Escherichia coli 2730350]|nr:hypothetical protein EC2730350_4856 [Escherichia coli 2730350]
MFFLSIFILAESTLCEYLSFFVFCFNNPLNGIFKLIDAE